MKPWIENLLSLQSLDMELRGIETRIATFPSEKARITAEVKASEAKVLAARNDLQALQLKIKNTEGQAAAVQEEVQKLRIQSGAIKKNNEYQAMLSVISAKEEEQSALETEALSLMDGVAPLQEKLASEEKRHASVVKNLREEVAELKEYAETLKQKYKETKSLRDAHEQSVNQNALEIYKRLMADKKGEALVPVTDGSCGFCSLKLTPQTINNAKRGDITLCDNCSRMIYIPDQM
ncbi:MAG: hypothetical protein IKB25_03075 [Lentisphaeria bacterium]|nr:hypothetical protein [Lentisphaeria bacterium]